MGTLEAAPVEELALSTQSLHHIDAPGAEITHIAAADVHWELSPLRTLHAREHRAFGQTVRIHHKQFYTVFTQLLSDKQWLERAHACCVFPCLC